MSTVYIQYNGNILEFELFAKSNAVMNIIQTYLKEANVAIQVTFDNIFQIKILILYSLSQKISGIIVVPICQVKYFPFTLECTPEIKLYEQMWIII